MPENSAIRIQRPNKLPRCYRSTADSIKDISYGGDIVIDFPSEHDNGIVTFEKAFDFNSGEIIININGKVSGKLLLNGGKFKNITAYTNNSSDILGNGMAYKKNSDNSFITDCAKNISDVTVTKAPFKITKQPGIKFISDISAGGIISVEHTSLRVMKMI